jgi:hypothetical protein
MIAMKKIIVSVLIVCSLSSLWFGKLHRTRECIVTNVDYDRLIVTLQHPNGWTYDCNVDCTENISEGEIVRVVFDEMTDWEKNYRVKEIK